MPDRDWDKELADIDRLIGSTPPEEPRAPAVAKPASRVAATAPARAPAPPTAAPAAPRRRWTAIVGLLARLLVVAVLLAGVVVWPYETRCGAWLAAYLATIAATALGAVWTAVAAWRHRAAFVHVLSLGVLATAIVYGAIEVLPRVGYAMPDPAHPAMWACR
jgi:cation transport ATPase